MVPTSHFRVGDTYSCYAIENGNKIYKMYYKAKTVSTLSYLLAHPYIKPEFTQTIYDTNIDEVVEYYTLMIFKDGIMKNKETKEEFYDKRLPLMKKNDFLKAIKESTKLLKENDEIFLYRVDDATGESIRALSGYKKFKGGLHKIDI